MNPSGSPLAARIALNPLVVIIIALVIGLAVFLFWFFSTKLQQIYNSPENIEKRKNLPTSLKDLKDISVKAHLTKNEVSLLSKITKSHPQPNIRFLLKDLPSMEPFYKEIFSEFQASGNESGKTNLFSLRSKLANAFKETILIKHTRNIPPETDLTYTPSKGVHRNLKLIDVNQEEFLLLMPPEMIMNNEKPEVLSKIELIFVYQNRNPYKLEARVIRYQKGKNDSDIMVLSHSDRISELQQRSSTRVDLNNECKFASVKVEKDKNGNENYVPSEKLHDGILADISAGGCRIFTKLPIKAEQHIFITGKFNKFEDAQATGLILRTTKNKNDEYILHIKFLKIDESTVNKINALASNYV